MSAARQPLSHEFAGLVHAAHPEMSMAQKLAGWHALRRHALTRERSLRVLLAWGRGYVPSGLAWASASGRSLALILSTRSGRAEGEDGSSASTPRAACSAFLRRLRCA